MLFTESKIYESDGAFADERLIAHLRTNGGRTNSLESIWCMWWAKTTELGNWLRLKQALFYIGWWEPVFHRWRDVTWWCAPPPSNSGNDRLLTKQSLKVSQSLRSHYQDLKKQLKKFGRCSMVTVTWGLPSHCAYMVKLWKTTSM